MVPNVSHTKDVGIYFYCYALLIRQQEEKPFSLFEKKIGIGMEEFSNFIKLYLSREERFHSPNPKSEVSESRLLISYVLCSLKKVFPRKHGQGHNISKFHGMTKLQYHMCLFGRPMNSYGGLGESSYEYFVKAPGDKTERRVHEFARQIAKRIYECMILK